MMENEKKWIQLNLHPSFKVYSKSDRDLSLTLLEKEGKGRWLLRLSNPEEPGCVVTISSNFGDEVKNHRVWLENEKFWIKQGETFSSVLELIKKSVLLTHLTEPLYPLKSVVEKKNYDDEGGKRKKKNIENYDDDGEKRTKKNIENYDDDGEKRKKKNIGNYDDDSISPLPKSKSTKEKNSSSLSKSSTPKKSSSTIKKSPSKNSKGTTSSPKSSGGKTKSTSTEPYVVLVMCGDKNIRMSIDASSVNDIVVAIEKECSLSNPFRVEYFDSDFNEYTQFSDLQSLKNKKGKLRIIVEPQSEWQFSSKFLENKNWQEHGSEQTPYRSILLKDQSVIVDPIEYKKFESILEKYGVPKDINITKVFAVQNDGLERAFIFNFQGLQEKFRSSPGLFKKDNWKKEKSSESRLWTYEQFKKKTEKFDWSHNPDVPILPVFHGTGKDTPWKIIQTGFTTIATVDDGYYGRGIYLTTSFEYSIFYSKMANKGSKVAYILVAFVLPGNPYPVIESPTSTPSFMGKGPADPSGYQSHYVCVNPKGSSGKFGFPCDPKTEKYYDELVIFQDYQVLPKYLIEVDAPNY